MHRDHIVMHKQWTLVGLLVGIALASSLFAIVFAQPVKSGGVVIAREDMPLLPEPLSSFLGLKAKPTSSVIRDHHYLVLDSKVIKALPENQIWIKLIPYDDRAGVAGWALFSKGNETRFDVQER